MADKWMQKAFSKNRGKFSAKAKAAGMSTTAYANKVLRAGSHASTQTKREASAARTGAKISRGRSKNNTQ